MRDNPPVPNVCLRAGIEVGHVCGEPVVVAGVCSMHANSEMVQVRTDIDRLERQLYDKKKRLEALTGVPK